MTLPARAAGKYGRRTPKNAQALRLRDILRAGATIPAPAHPTNEDYLARLNAWNMLGNDQAGDCVAVTWANFRRLVTALIGSGEHYPNQADVWQIYRTQNPDFDPNGSADTNGPGSNADQGMDIQTLLEYLIKTGGPDGVKALAFAKVDYTNVDELDAALAIFGGVWVGANVLQANMDEFDIGHPWDYVAGSPLDGGHSVLAGGYRPGQVCFITWGEETTFTDAFRQHQVEEAWIVVWPEHLGSKQFEAGIDQAALSAAYQELTGRPFPVQPTPPAPTPGPVPTPTPTPVPVPPAPAPAPVVDPADAAFAAVLKPWLHHHHVGDNAHVAKAGKAWIATKEL